MGKAVKKVFGFIISPLSIIDKDLGKAVQAVALVTAGVLTGNVALIATGLSIGASLLSPKAKSPDTSAANADRLTVSIDLRTPRKIIFGTTAMATDLRDQEWSSDQTYLHRFVVNASHKASGYRQIWFDDKLAWTSTGGVQGEFVGYLNVTTVLEGSAGNAINIGPRMGSSRRYTGCAYVYFRYKLTGNSKKTESPFSQSIPTRVTIVGDGAPVYDPRLDSTAGGSGPQRAGDQSNWTWNADAARNPALQLLWYLLGWRIAGKLAVGKGIPAARIDLGSFITAANMCDEPVAKAAGGTEPRYRSDGIFSEADDLSLVADNLKSAMNAVLDDVDGRWRLSILHNDLATPRPGMITQDVLGAFTWDQTPPLSSTINVIRGGYTDPSTTSLYQLADYPEIRIDGPDGIERPQTVNLPLVQSQSQAKRLIKLRLQRAIFGGTFKADFQVNAWRYVKGDVFPFTFAPLGFEAKLFRIAEMSIQVDGRVSMILREEHADIYLAEDDENAAIVGVEPTVYQPALTPILQDLSNLNDVLDRVTSDGYLSGVEKRQVVIDHQALHDQRDALQARFIAIGSPGDIKTAGDAAFAGVAALDAYLASLAPAWDNPATSTPIVPADYRAAWGNAYQAVSAFAAAITGLSGAGSWTHIANSPTTIVTPTSGRGTSGATWRTDASQSLEAFERGCSVSFTLPVSHNDDIMAGLSSHPGSSLSFDRISFAVFRQSDGYIDLRVEAETYSVVAGNYLFPIACRIEFDGVNTVRWYIDATLRATFYWPYPDAPLYFATALAGQDPRVENISFRSIGARGLNGLDGSDGVDGLNGQSIHIAYADSADGSANFTTGAAGGRTYIGVYTDTNPGADSGDYHAYGWTRLRGADGSNGLAGPGGYVHTAYANSADGSIDFHISDPTGRSYLGAYTDQTLADSTDYHAYAWSLIRGTDGVSASTVELSASSLNFAAAYDGTIKSGQQPQYVQASYKVGAADVTGSASWAIAASSNCAASINSAGQVGITSVTGDGYVDVRGSYGGVTPATKRVSFKRTLDAPPPAGATSLSLSVSGTQFASASSFPAGVTGAILTVTANAAGQLQCIYQLSYYADPSSGGASTFHFYAIAGVARYRLAGTGGAWNDYAGGAITGESSSSSGSSIEPESEGTLAINQTQTGLTAGAQYEVGVALRRSSNLRSTQAAYSGSITVKQP